ncbi:MAG: MBL fold metallo-hydrolase [Salinarchaeum sp.]
MDVTFLGTGSAMPTGERFQTGLVLTDADTRLLLDCGSGTLQRLEQYGPGYEAISTVLLSHHHLDHIADLMPLCKARWLAGESELTIAGPEGTATLVENLFETHAYMQDRLDVTIRELTPGEHTVGGFELEAMATDHSMPTLAYRFGNRFVFGADSAPTESLAAFFDEVAVGVHDCSFPDGVDVSNHPTPSGLSEAFDAAAPDLGRLYLTHFYPHAEGQTDAMADAVAEATGIDVRPARDGLSVSITPR